MFKYNYPPQDSKKNKEKYVNIAKGMAICAVVMMHINYNDIGRFLPTKLLFGYSWHVAVFFLIGNDIAFEGISDTYRKFMLHADSPEEYAKQINEMAISIESRQQYKRMFMENYVKQSIVNFVENL